MADTIRKRIKDAVNARLKSILIANGYETDAGRNVFYFNDTPYERDELPCLEFRDSVTGPETPAHQLYLYRMMLQVTAWAAGAAANDATHLLAADLFRAVGVDETWGGLAEQTDRQDLADEIEVKHKGGRVAGIRMEFEIRFTTTERWNPYV